MTTRPLNYTTKIAASRRISAREHRLLSENVTLAMELGAKVVWLASEDIAGELLRFAREQGVTLAIFGKTRLSKARRLVQKSPIEVFAKLGTGVPEILEAIVARLDPDAQCP